MDKSSFLVISLSQYHSGLEARIAVFKLKKLDVSVETNHESLNDYYRSFLITWLATMQISWNKRKFFHKKRV